jgi:hypothetical protein
MPATVQTDPPGIWCMFSDGSTARFDLDGLPCPGLAADLLTGLAELIHPHGRIDAEGTVSGYILAFREMARGLAAAGFAGRAADLRRSHLIEYWLGTTGPRESCTRRALQAFARNGGAVDPVVAELVAGRNFNPLPFRRPLPPYREAGWDRLTATCAEVAGTAFTARKEALAAAARGAHPGRGRLVPGEYRLAAGPDRAGRGRPARAADRLLLRDGPQAERLPGGQRDPVPGAGRGDRLPAAVRHLFRHRP